MKKIIAMTFAALSIVLMQGCASYECKKNDNCVQSDAFGASFNDQQYVWEGFIFSTNRVEKVK